MINAANQNDIKFAFKNVDNPFLARIVCQAEMYCEKYPFCDYWIQYASERAVAAFAKYYGRITAYFTDDSDFEEASYFLNMAGFGSFISDEKYKSRLNIPGDFDILKGSVLKFAYGAFAEPEATDGKENISISEISAKECYSVLRKCEGKSIDLPPFDIFYTDISHEMRRGKTKIFGIKADGTVASVGCASFICNSSVTVSALATKEKYRKRGYAGALVRHVSKLYENKSLYVCSYEENLRFYQNLGFERYCDFFEAV